VSCPRNSHANFWDKQATRINNLCLAATGSLLRGTSETGHEGYHRFVAQTRLEEIVAAHAHVRDPQDREVELAFWESVRESDNPDSLKAYLQKHPEGEFRPLAEIRLKELGT